LPALAVTTLKRLELLTRLGCSCFNTIKPNSITGQSCVNGRRTLSLFTALNPAQIPQIIWKIFRPVHKKFQEWLVLLCKYLLPFRAKQEL
jgi:hypothetical protein